VHIAAVDALHGWARNVPDYAWKLAGALWPGPLSLVLPRSARVPDAVTGGQDTVALRVPAHPLTRRLLEDFGGGLAAPSANRYGHISPTTVEHVRSEFGDDTPFVLDGGPCKGGIESTIVGCLESTPRILRPGLVSVAEVARVTGLPVSQHHQATASVRTAGQDVSHYAPTTPAVLVDRLDPSSWPEVEGRRAGYLGFADPDGPVTVDVRLPEDPEAAAQRLYAELRRLDESGLELIVLEAPPPGPEWDGIRDRLQRAAAPRDDAAGPMRR
jgi:L-threonylcarbamoyladenylate synthase